ncbi:hypothetical protein LGT39_05855 [Demequina sp. TTPB684]|uniref:hypothetical protein n=1 Tax=unclassified Demequina TaxID=2620311 RepID=UPI001CF3CD1C|nr:MULTISPECIES: hypothetical protein [unclassified Demequina]MCB2412372.1 hypothetical protein [Demequina sp. TTPB684]UPU89042.1 hypothetical protein LGT36_003710 [Demequina sp. TMPB413]
MMQFLSDKALATLRRLTSPRQRVRQDALNALSNRKPGQVYAGTANHNQVAKRRAKNRVARRSRAVNRQRR